MSSRRELFRRLGGHPPTRRPPWTAADFAEGCTGCAACVEACPEGVLKLGAGRLVELDLSSAGCTLCGECASRCEAGLFDGARPAFPWIATIGEACLALAGIHCRSCQDACEPAAIRFRPAPGGVALAELDSQRCNGCGAAWRPVRARPSNCVRYPPRSLHDMPEALQIASLILHCRPERLPAVKANLALLDGLEIYQESPQGKLILVLEAEREEQILDTLGQLQNLPGVLNAVLVYHEILHDDDSNDAAAMTDRAIPCSPEETIDEPHPS